MVNIKIAIIVDGILVPRYIYDIAFWIKEEKGFELSLIIQKIPKKTLAKQNKLIYLFYKILNYSPRILLWKIINFIEKYYLKIHNLNFVFDILKIIDCSKKNI